MSGHTVEEVLPKNHEALPEITKYELSDYDHNLSANLSLPRLIFSTPEDIDHSQVIANLKTGLQNVLTDMPFVGGKIYNDPSTKKIQILRQNHEPIHLGINSLDTPESSFPDYATLAAQKFPLELLNQNISKLVPPGVNPNLMFRDDGSAISVFQVTFIKGGIILIVGLNHLWGDAKSLDHIFALWASSTKATFTNTPLPSFQPVLNREYFTAGSTPTQEEIEEYKKKPSVFGFVKIDPDAPATNDPPPAPPLSNETYHFSAKAVLRLKESLKPKDPGAFVSTYDCVAGATWRAMTKARVPSIGLTDSSVTSYAHAVNIRERAKSVPSAFFGNGFWMAITYPVDCATLFSDEGLAKAALAVRESIIEVNESSVPDFLRLQRGVDGKEALQFKYQPGMVIGTSWNVMRVEEYDFGFGTLTNIGLSNQSFEGAITVLPALTADGDRDGVNVCVVLEKGCAERMLADEEYSALFRE